MNKNKLLEDQLRKEYNNYQSKVHPDDKMSFIDYIYGIGSFKGYKIKIKEDFNLNLIIKFSKI